MMTKEEREQYKDLLQREKDNLLEPGEYGFDRLDELRMKFGEFTEDQL
jgi:hypothetical protein